MKENYQFKNTIATEEELRSIIGFPSELVRKKVISYLDDNCKEFISKSPFFVISTSDVGSHSSERLKAGTLIGFIKLIF